MPKSEEPRRTCAVAERARPDVEDLSQFRHFEALNQSFSAMSWSQMKMAMFTTGL
jgi:hypothetical protein